MANGVRSRYNNSTLCDIINMVQFLREIAELCNPKLMDEKSENKP